MRRLLAALMFALPAWIGAQDGPLPFAIGERFTYGVKVAKMGASGKGEMWVSGPEVVRGTETFVLHMNSRAGLGPFRGGEESTSWIDPLRMADLRFSKIERGIFSSHRDEIEIYPTQRRWTAGDGSSGETITDSPLDELSFIYFVRTLPLLDDSVYVVERHYDKARNPTSIRVVGHEQLDTKAGTFSTLKVEMRVKDPLHYQGDGVILFNFSDDPRRIPVRIESTAPSYGRTVLLIESISPAP